MGKRVIIFSSILFSVIFLFSINFGEASAQGDENKAFEGLKGVDQAYRENCVIATASYGSPMAKEVQMLREIRDNQLLQTQSGSAFMSGFNTVYYSFAPTIAQ